MVLLVGFTRVSAVFSYQNTFLDKRCKLKANVCENNPGREPKHAMISRADIRAVGVPPSGSQRFAIISGVYNLFDYYHKKLKKH